MEFHQPTEKSCIESHGGLDRHKTCVPVFATVKLEQDGCELTSKMDTRGYIYIEYDSVSKTDGQLIMNQRWWIILQLKKRRKKRL